MAPGAGFEPATRRSEVCSSIQLSYPGAQAPVWRSPREESIGAAESVRAATAEAGEGARGERGLLAAEQREVVGVEFGVERGKGRLVEDGAGGLGPGVGLEA